MKLDSTLWWNLNTEYIAGTESGKVGFIKQTIPTVLKHLCNKAYTFLAHLVQEYKIFTLNSHTTGNQA